jgi:hypothetical protein
MGKKSVTPETPAQTLAREYAELIAVKKDLESQIEAKKAAVLAAFADDPTADFICLTVVENSPKPKFNFGTLTASAQKRLLEQIKTELPEFVIEKSDLDIERIWTARETNPAVKNCLAAHGVSITQEAGYTVRINK